MRYDVCIIGGGPAGAAIAMQLAGFGHKVVIIERAATPPPNIGLTLSPGVNHWLQVLGVQQQVVEAGFTPALTSTIRWESPDPLVKHAADGPGGYHVDRSHFDQILLSHACQRGADLIRPATIKKLQQKNEAGWELEAMSAQGTFRLSARILVEATGRKSVLKHGKTSFLPATLATYAIWEKEKCRETSFIEAGKNEWYWGAPVAQGYMTCIFSDPSAIKAYPSPAHFFRERMQFSTLFDTAKRSLPKEVTVCAATATRDNCPVAATHIKVGDSACTMDPISSQGIQKALKTAVQGAVVVNTLLSDRDSAPAIHFYSDMVRRECATHEQVTRGFYDRQGVHPGTSFWKVRGSGLMKGKEAETHMKLTPQQPLYINPAASIQRVPVLGSMFVETEEGLCYESDAEPLVFMQNIVIVPVLRACHGKPLYEVRRTIAALMQGADPDQVLRYLLYNRILCA